MATDDSSKGKRVVLAWAVFFFISTLIIVWYTALPFSGYLQQQSLSRFWLFVSDSGAQWGVGTVAIIATYLVYKSQTDSKVGMKRAMVFLSGLSLLLGGLALNNEFIVKPSVAAQRPSILKLDALGIIDANTFYALPDKETRREYLRKALRGNPIKVAHAEIHPAILKHWEVEAGFSLPSGHSQNAFMFGTVLAFFLFRIFKRARWLFVVPLLWALGIAISRVAVGAHSPLDVTVGSLIGLAVAGLVIFSSLPDRLLSTN